MTVLWMPWDGSQNLFFGEDEYDIATRKARGHLGHEAMLEEGDRYCSRSAIEVGFRRVIEGIYLLCALTGHRLQSPVGFLVTTSNRPFGLECPDV